MANETKKNEQNLESERVCGEELWRQLIQTDIFIIGFAWLRLK